MSSVRLGAINFLTLAGQTRGKAQEDRNCGTKKVAIAYIFHSRWTQLSLSTDLKRATCKCLSSISVLKRIDRFVVTIPLKPYRCSSSSDSCLNSVANNMAKKESHYPGHNKQLRSLMRPSRKEAKSHWHYLTQGDANQVGSHRDQHLQPSLYD